MNPSTANKELDTFVNTDPNKLLIKVLIIVIIGFIVVGYLGVPLIFKAKDEKFQEKKEECETWKNLYFKERDAHDGTKSEYIKDSRNDKVKFDTIQQLIIKRTR